MSGVTLHLGDCIEVMRTMADASVDAIVTDPPYHLTNNGGGPHGKGADTPYAKARAGAATTGFMGKAWDGGDIAQRVELWAEALRVLKPGGHLLAFGGSRTYHRMVCAIEDAGFEVRDQIMWLYGSGFPKSLDVSKAIDKQAGAERTVVSEGKAIKRMIPGADQDATGSWIKDNGREYVPQVTVAATAAAAQWDGWGTALKPAHEPICVARKPLIGTVAANVLAHGTGALNIDACRIAVTDDAYARNCSGDRGHDQNRTRTMEFGMTAGSADPLGRWPANVAHDGSEEVLAGFPAQAGARAPVHTRNGDKFRNSYGAFAGNIDEAGSTFQGDSGSAARFFYCAKASAKDRDEGLDGFERHQAGIGDERPCGSSWERRAPEKNPNAPRANIHPTVKPVSLLQWLVRLVTPPGGTVLDFFMGSGSIGKACVREGFDFIGIEIDAGYLAIAEARCAHEQARVAAASVPPPQPDLFQEQP